MLKTVIILIAIAVFPLSISVANNKPACKEEIISHSGGTDKCGCHYNRKTGVYHCHNRKQRGGDCPS